MGIESHPSTETRRIEKILLPGALGAARPADFQKVLEELKALKQRSYTLDLQRLEDSQRQELDQAMKAAEKRVRGGGAELLKAQSEERRIAESKHARDKELLNAKFQKLDQTLTSLAVFLNTVGPARDMESKLHEREVALKKQEEELNVHRKVFAREKDELDEERRLMQAAEDRLRDRERDLEAKLKNLDVVARAAELDQMREELDGKVKSYGEQEAVLEKEREALNQDFDKLGEARADVDRVTEGLDQERNNLERQKSDVVDAVAKEMAATFEAFVRDMAKEHLAKPKPKAAPEKPAPKKTDAWGDLPP